MANKSVDLLKKEGATFLRFGEAGSSIRWGVHASLKPRGYGEKKHELQPQLIAQVYLTDCTRQIEWDINTEEDLEKLDKAIDELTKMRKATRKAFDRLLPHGFGEEEKE